MPELAYFNGINGVTGDYLMRPHTHEEVASGYAARLDDSIEVLAAKEGASKRVRGVSFSRDPTRIDSVGWGVVFHQDEAPEVKEAVGKLIDHRREQIRNDSIVKVLEYTVADSCGDGIAWLRRHGVASGSIHEKKIPAYLLLVGGPEKIPFEFGHFLDIEYAVGRIHFPDVQGYQAYVNSLIAYESGEAPQREKEVAFFGPHHDGDPATRMSAESLIPRLADTSSEDSLVRQLSGLGFTYRPNLVVPERSTKEALHELYRPAASGPALLFTASHGLGWPAGHPDQRSLQGALLCQDSPGPGFGKPKREHYFAAGDLGSDASVHGLVCFHFACYGVGTPAEDRFFHRPGEPPPKIAAEPFFSALPQALLSHRGGGALGVIGHVERSYTSSIAPAMAGLQPLPFENVLGYILRGWPIGYALKDFNERYAALSAAHAARLERRDSGRFVSALELSEGWTTRNDAEAYTLFGDPGARLRVLRDDAED